MHSKRRRFVSHGGIKQFQRKDEKEVGREIERERASKAEKARLRESVAENRRSESGSKLGKIEI